MGNYDHSVQRNIDKKFMKLGKVAQKLVQDVEVKTPGDVVTTPPTHGSCDSLNEEGCVRAMEYMRRIVKSLLRQMNVHSHVFGPGEAITIDLQAELKYDDYVVLTKFTNSNLDFDKYLYRIDEIMSNFIHVVEHSSSRFEFADAILNFPAFYSLKFWVILFTSMVIGSLIVLLFVKAFNTRQIFNQLLYGFLIIFIVSCVWSFSSMYEDKKAEAMAHMVQANKLPPNDCDYTNWNIFQSALYWIRTSVFRRKDECQEYYRTMMTDPFWKVNPMEAISTSMAYFVFSPLDYIGTKLGGFYTGFIEPAPWILQPVMLAIAVFFTVLLIIGPFRISSPLVTIEPVWRPELPALERHQVHHAIGHERVRNEIMERPDGPVIKSVRNASTDMDGFHEFLTGEADDELELNGPFARFNDRNEGDTIRVDDKISSPEQKEPDEVKQSKSLQNESDADSRQSPDSTMPSQDEIKEIHLGDGIKGLWL